MNDPSYFKGHILKKPGRSVITGKPFEKENQQTTDCCAHCEDNAQGGNQATFQNKKVGALGILFFLFPVIGWILYFVWKSDQPGKARTAGRMAWIGFGIFAVCILIGFMVVIFMPRYPHLSAARVAVCMHHQEILENACAMYYAESALSGNPKYPDTLNALVEEGFIDEVPQCPEGVPYTYDNTTGDIRCEQSTDGQSHLLD